MVGGDLTEWEVIAGAVASDRVGIGESAGISIRAGLAGGDRRRRQERAQTGAREMGSQGGGTGIYCVEGNFELHVEIEQCCTK